MEASHVEDEICDAVNHTIESVKESLPNYFGDEASLGLQLAQRLCDAAVGRCNTKRTERATSVLEDLERAAKKLDGDSEENKPLKMLVDSMDAADVVITSELLQKHLATAQSTAVRDYYETYKQLESLSPLADKITKARTPYLDDAGLKRMEMFLPGKLPGRKIVAILTSVQALQRPLVKGETRGSVTNKYVA
eukprot:3211878-Pyramimonas_sp.AAC.1